MRAVKTLQQLLISSLVKIHAARIESVFWAVSALIRGGRLSLTGLGRASGGAALTKHNIKRVDRLLGNTKLQKQTDTFYRAIAALLIGGKKRPVIAVDWTGIGAKYSALVAAVPIDGRAIPIFIKVYSYKVNNNSTIETRFLRKLKDILPSECCPILVTDAGYRNVWFKEVRKMGWDFVGRILSRAHARSVDGQTWQSTQSIFKKAIFTAKDLGNWILAKSNPLQVRLVTIKNRPTGRKTKRVGVKGNAEARQRSRKPWLLATSLFLATPQKVVRVYSVRFQIEESFRDTKNSRFGWCFRHARSRGNGRIEILLLIATLGLVAMMLIGQTAERKELHKDFQANTVRTKRVLSLFYLAKNILWVGKEKTFLVGDYHLSAEDLRGKLHYV
jgi:hypothetical protein